MVVVKLVSFFMRCVFYLVGMKALENFLTRIIPILPDNVVAHLGVIQAHIPAIALIVPVLGLINEVRRERPSVEEVSRDGLNIVDEYDPDYVENYLAAADGDDDGCNTDEDEEDEDDEPSDEDEEEDVA